MGTKKSNSDGGRTRSWNIIVYPESAPSNWRDVLDDMHLEWIESPLHDKDINATGEPKKPHYHVTICFSGVKSYDQVLEITKALNCPIPQRCHNAKASVRYMAHLDNPDKAQYNVFDIKPHGGIDVSELLRPSSSERYELIRDMMIFVKDNCIIEFQDLMDYAMQHEYDTWFPLLCDNSAYVVGNYIKSQRHRLQPQKDDE